MDEQVKKLSDLRKRIRRFLDSSAYGRDEIANLLGALTKVGDGALIGGMLRDIALEGTKKFCSDIDVVIACDDPSAIQHVLASQLFPWTRNRFGGYRVELTKWKVDVWTLKSTWAFRERLVAGNSFEDLLRTTFFDWDAIVYLLGSNQIIAIDGYLDRLGDRALGLNLKTNPNPEGNAVKALRYAAKYSARFSDSLADYLGEVLAPYSDNEICTMERKSHEKPTLMATDVETLMTPLRRTAEHLALPRMRARKRQYELWP